MLRRRVLRFFYLRTDNEYLEAFHEPFTQFWKRTWNFNDDPKGNSDANPQESSEVINQWLAEKKFPKPTKEKSGNRITRKRKSSQKEGKRKESKRIKKDSSSEADEPELNNKTIRKRKSNEKGCKKEQYNDSSTEIDEPPELKSVVIKNENLVKEDIESSTSSYQPNEEIFCHDFLKTESTTSGNIVEEQDNPTEIAQSLKDDDNVLSFLFDDNLSQNQKFKKDTEDIPKGYDTDEILSELFD